MEQVVIVLKYYYIVCNCLTSTKWVDFLLLKDDNFKICEICYRYVFRKAKLFTTLIDERARRRVLLCNGEICKKERENGIKIYRALFNKGIFYITYR